MPKIWSVKSKVICACAEAKDECGFELRMFLRKFC